MGVFTRQNRKAVEPVLNLPSNGSQSANNWSSYELKNRIHRHLIERIELAKVDLLPRAEVEQQIRQLVEDLLAEEETPLSRWERNQIIEDRGNECDLQGRCASASDHRADRLPSRAPGG
jgi:hypothetical protein